jgi:hypothetical protein
MAEQENLFKRLRKLFSTGVIVRHVGGKKLKVADTDYVQSTLSNSYRDRFSRIYSSAGAGQSSQYGINMSYHTQRLMLFNEYDLMDADPIINSALDVYADECTLKDEYDEVVTIQTDDENIKEILDNLFYDILNLDYNLYPWIRNLCKYGDQFLFVEIAEKYGVVNVTPLSVYDTIRVEGDDPNNPRYTFFETIGLHGKKDKFEEYEVIHFRLMNDANWLPYGKGMIEGARRVWKQLTLMEDAMLIHRIMRAPEKRVIKLDIGNIPPAEIDTYVQRIADKMKKVPFVDPQTGDYNLRFNIMNILEDFYIPVRGGDSGTEITNLSGLEFNSIEDIEYLRNRMMSGLKIPKAFLGYDESINGKATLAAEDVRFARTIERIQRIIVAELKKIAIIHLYAQGFADEELLNFDLKLTIPSTIYEQEKINLWKEKVQLATDFQNLKMVGSQWVYEHVFNFSEQEIEKQRGQIAEDVKFAFRLSKIEAGESDPEKYGYPQDQQPVQEAGGETGEAPDMGAMGMGESTIGRPKTGQKYGQDSHPAGRDPLGFKERYAAIQSSEKKRENPRKSPLSTEVLNRLGKKLGLSTGSKATMLIENDDLDAGTFLDLSNIDNDIES